MSFYSFLFKNVYRNPRLYLSYYLNSLVAILVFYIFSFLNYHPVIRNSIGGSSQLVNTFALFGLKASQFLVVLLSFIFLSFSLTSFLNKRKKDIVIYQMLGMKTHDIKKLLCGENFIVGICALVSGLLLGDLLSKSILFLLSNILAIQNLASYFPIRAILMTSGSFISLYLLLNIIFFNFFKLSRSNTKKLSPTQFNRTLSLLSILCISLSYFLVYLFIESASYILLVSAICFSVSGTFLFFNYALPIYLQQKKRKRAFWGEKLLELTDSINQSKKRNMMYAAIASSASVALVACASMLILGSNEFLMKGQSLAAYSFSPQVSKKFNSQYKNIDEVTSAIEKWIQEEGYNSSLITVPMTPITYKESVNEDYAVEHQVIPLSSYNKLAQEYSLPRLNIGENTLIKLTSDSQEKSELSRKGKKSIVYFEFGNIKRKGELVETACNFSLTPFESAIFVGPDQLLSSIRSESKSRLKTYELHTLLNFKEWDKNAVLNNKIKNFIQSSRNDEGEAISYFSKYENKLEKKRSNVFILLSGFLLVTVFIVFSSSILSLYLFGDLEEDVAYYKILHQLGLSPKMRKRLVTKKILNLYVLPGIISMIHFTVSFLALQHIVNVHVWQYYFEVGIFYIVLQFFLFLKSKRKYLKQLSKNIEQ